MGIGYDTVIILTQSLFIRIYRGGIPLTCNGLTKKLWISSLVTRKINEKVTGRYDMLKVLTLKTPPYMQS